ncbi:MAG: hypothetical protein ACJ73S_26050 [Mycobacteriales bacterium]
MKGNSTTRPRRGPVPALATGFTLSALACYAAAWAAGALLFGHHRHTAVARLAAAAVTATFLIVDTRLFGLRTPMWRRQTPREHFHRHGPTRGAFVWGLDTGLVFSTYRITSLSWVALTLTLAGLVPWWAGLAYAAGFVLPAAALILLVPAGRPDTEPFWLTDRVASYEPVLRRLALGLLAAATLALAVTA